MKYEMYRETEAVDQGYDRTRKQLKRVELNYQGIKGYYVVGRIHSHTHKAQGANNSIYCNRGHRVLCYCGNSSKL